MSKPFKETRFAKIAGAILKTLAPGLANAVQGAGSVAEAIGLIRESTELAPEHKYELEKLAVEHEKELTKRLESDNAQDSWLPRNIRPVTLVVLVVTFVVGFFFNYDVTVIHGPLGIVFGFYFGSRGIEKVVRTLKR